MSSHDVPAVEARELMFGVPGAVLCGPVDLQVAQGKTLGIVGETGSGKSLLCRTLAGMLDAVGGAITGGSLAYRGQEVSSADRREWSRLRRHVIGYMPQASMSGLNPVRTVGSQLVEAVGVLKSVNRADAAQQASVLLDQVSLRDTRRVMASYPHELSGGMRQRVMLAMAIAGDPAVLIADEPTTALDASVQNEVLDLLSAVQQDRRMAMVIVSHDVRVMRRVCDDVAVMYGGRVVESGPVSQVTSQAAHHYTLALQQADPAFATRRRPLGAIPGLPRSPLDWHDGGCIFRDRCPAVADGCSSQVPPLLEVRPSQRAACFYPRQDAT